MHLRRVVPAILTAALLASCELFTGSDSDPGNLVMSPNPLVLDDSTSAQLAVQDESGAEIDPLRLRFSSANPAVATVDQSGVVLGTGPGETQIVAQMGKSQVTATVTVRPVARVIRLELDSVVNTGAPVPWTARVLDRNGRAVAGTSIRITLRQDSPGFQPFHSDSATTDAEGRAQIQAAVPFARPVQVEARVVGPVAFGPVTGVVRARTPAPDPESPSVQITYPFNGTKNTTGSFGFNAFASDNVAVVLMTYQFNGGAERLGDFQPAGGKMSLGASVGTASDSLSLKPDTNVVVVRAYDAAGNVGTDTLWVRRVNNFSIRVVSPREGATIYSGGLAVVGYVSAGPSGDSRSWPARMTYRLDQGSEREFQSSGLHTSELLSGVLVRIPVPIGKHMVELVAYDTAGRPGGEDTLRVTRAPAPSTFREVTGTHGSTCAATEAGKVYCWGANGESQLGNGTIATVSAAVAVAGEFALEHLVGSAAGATVCGLTSVGRAYCWGNGFPGGNRFVDYSTPTPVAAGQTFRLLKLGGGFICGLAADGRLHCWGANNYGQLGTGAAGGEQPAPVVAAGGRTFVDVALAKGHACGIAQSGATYCWGFITSSSSAPAPPPSGQVCETGRHDIKYYCFPAPVEVPSPVQFQSIAAGEYRTCGIAEDGRAYCWRMETLAAGSAPSLLSDELRFRSIGISTTHACGITTSNSVYCWGSDHRGQLGNGSTTATNSPTRVAGDQTFQSIAVAGSGHSCGVTQGGEVYCWGANDEGQLGLEHWEDAHEPRQALK